MEFTTKGEGMSPEILKSLMQIGGPWVLFLLALWLFRNQIYFSFGQPPAGVWFDHPEEVINRARNDAAPATTAPKQNGRRARERRSP
jgi:hypothetical protein